MVGPDLAFDEWRPSPRLEKIERFADPFVIGDRHGSRYSLSDQPFCSGSRLCRAVASEADDLRPPKHQSVIALAY